MTPDLYGRRYKAPDESHLLLAVDLGKSKLGVAAFIVDPWPHDPFLPPTRLAFADTLIVPRPKGAVDVARRIYLTLDGTSALRTYHGRPWVWVCEWPQKYPDQRKYHKQIDALQDVGRALAEHVKWTAKYTPKTWKGNVPKPAHHRRLAAVLSAFEREVAPPFDKHDAWDAIGIGLYALGRTGRGGVVP